MMPRNDSRKRSRSPTGSPSPCTLTWKEARARDRRIAITDSITLRREQLVTFALQRARTAVHNAVHMACPAGSRPAADQIEAEVAYVFSDYQTRLAVFFESPQFRLELPSRADQLAEAKICDETDDSNAAHRTDDTDYSQYDRCQYEFVLNAQATYEAERRYIEQRHVEDRTARLQLVRDDNDRQLFPPVHTLRYGFFFTANLYEADTESIDSDSE